MQEQLKILMEESNRYIFYIFCPLCVPQNSMLLMISIQGCILCTGSPGKWVGGGNGNFDWGGKK